MENEELKKVIDERIKAFSKGQGFTSRKLTDTPTDDLMVVNRKYVNLNGIVDNRPSSIAAIIGQRYYATDIGIPMTYDGTLWRDGIGSVVASN